MPGRSNPEYVVPKSTPTIRRSAAGAEGAGVAGVVVGGSASGAEATLFTLLAGPALPPPLTVGAGAGGETTLILNACWRRDYGEIRSFNDSTVLLCNKADRKASPKSSRSLMNGLKSNWANGQGRTR